MTSIIFQFISFAAKDGTVEPTTDQDLESTVLAIQGANISTTLISCPSDSHKTLGIKLPWIVFLVKNLDEHFSLEIEILDDKKYRRRFRASTFQVIFNFVFFHIPVGDSLENIPVRLLFNLYLLTPNIPI